MSLMSRLSHRLPAFRRQGSLTLLVSVLLVLMLFFTQAAIAEPPKHYTDLKFRPIPEVQVPPYTRFKLKNGMVVYLMEDHELPLVEGTALFQTGARFEPASKIGLADIVGDVMRSGGTTQHPADQLNQLLEQRAASIETDIGGVVGSASFDTLTENLPEVLSLFAEVIRQPLFPQDKIDLAKTQIRGAIARRNDDPDEILGREFQKLIYGAGNPYGRTVEYNTLERITREDVVQFYQTYFHPNNMILGVVGDFDSKAMRSLLEQTFGAWQPNPNFKKPPLPAVAQAQKGGIFLVDQPQLTQSSIQLGHLGGQLNSRDYAALSVMNEVLNGFAGRLFNRIRSREGLAYSVYAAWDAEYDYPGLFIAGGQTRSNTTLPFIQSLTAELERIRTQSITPQELTTAKDSVLNSFVFNFQKPVQTLSRLMGYEYFGYPPDFIFRYRRAIEQTTIADVQRVARTYLKPENFVVLVVGNAAAIKPPLAQLDPKRPVTRIDVTIPPDRSKRNPTAAPNPETP